MITVVNKRTHTGNTKNDFYIGRGSILGNPYTHIKTKYTKADYVLDTRDQAMDAYEEYLTKKIKERDSLICEELNKIWQAAKMGDVNLICYCVPKKCHGNFIKNVINSKL
jgi:hypothetical protein